MKLLRCAIASLSFLSGSALLSYSLYHFGADLKVKAIAEAEGATRVAYHNKEASRWSALQAMAEVESKRTDVELAMQKVAIAENRLQRACTKLKGRC